MSSTSSLREQLSAHRAALAVRAAQPAGDGYALSVYNAEIIEALIAAAYADAVAATPGACAEDLAVVAVGSFGRGALPALADVDVRLLCAELTPRHAALSEALLYRLWDAGLSVGHQVLTVRDLLGQFAEDLTAATALLDVRCVAGDAELVRKLERLAYAGPLASAQLEGFLRRLGEEASKRHAQFGDSVYLLEPDVKNGAGGTRDLESALWAVKARFRPRLVRAQVLPALVQLGVLVPREQEQMEDARDFLHRIRNQLHLCSGRRTDRLTFERQEELAQKMGFFPEEMPADDDPQAALGPAVERLMQRYYQAARTVSQARELLLQRAKPSARRRARPQLRELEPGIALWDEHVTLRSAELVASEPVLMLRALRCCVREERKLWPHARDLLLRLLHDTTIGQALRDDAEAGALFVELLSSVADSPFGRSALAEMHELGLLAAMVPEFVPVLGRVHHDLYHVYTVDVHSVAAADAVRAIARGESAARWPLASRVFSELAQPRALFLAALLHDVGKGYPDASGSRKNHSERGAELAREILPRLGADAHTTSLVSKVIAEHLLMYHTATRRDLDDPATVADFCAKLGSREVLDHLYVLTLVDVATTAPKALTSWKASLVDELYRRAAEQLDAAGTPQPAPRLEEGLTPEQAALVRAFVASMPQRYAAHGSPARALAHAELAREARSSQVACAMFDDAGDTVELAIACEDSLGVLSWMAAALSAGRLEVVAAQIASRRDAESGHAQAFNRFWVRDRSDGAAAARQALPRLRADLRALWSGELSPRELLAYRTNQRRRAAPAVPSEVILHDAASPDATVIEVFGRDRRGLLFELAHTLSELNLSIVSSRINTEGNRVADVFYVQTRDGQKLAPARFAQVRAALLAVVDAPAAL